MTKSLYTVGEALAVFLAEAPLDSEIDPGGDLATATRFDRLVSGAEVNMAVGFARAGHRSRLLTRVGDDALGEAIVGQLAQWGIDAVVHRDHARPTGVLVRSVGGGHRGHAVNLRAGAAIESLTSSDVEESWPSEVDVVFLTGVTAVRSESAAAAVHRAAELGRASGAIVVLDPNLRPALASRETYAERLGPLRGSVDIVLGDEQELAVFAECATSEASQKLLAEGARWVVTKMGAEGATATNGVTTVYSPSLVSEGEVVDSVGAGDAFAAALVAALVEALPIGTALERAAMAAAAVVRTRGDIPPGEGSWVR